MRLRIGNRTDIKVGNVIESVAINHHRNIDSYQILLDDSIDENATCIQANEIKGYEDVVIEISSHLKTHRYSYSLEAVFRQEKSKTDHSQIDMNSFDSCSVLPCEVALDDVRGVRRLALKFGCGWVWIISSRPDVGLESMVVLDLNYIESRTVAQEPKLSLDNSRNMPSGKGAA